VVYANREKLLPFRQFGAQPKVSGLVDVVTTCCPVGQDGVAGSAVQTQVIGWVPERALGCDPAGQAGIFDVGFGMHPVTSGESVTIPGCCPDGQVFVAGIVGIDAVGAQAKTNGFLLAAVRCSCAAQVGTEIDG
jgi:hypothetical protein